MEGASPIRDPEDGLSRPLLILGTVIGLILAPACADLTAPVDRAPFDDYELPPPDTSLGGRITYWWDFIDGMAIVLPDRSVPALRGRDDVEYVQVNGVACLA